MSRPAAIREDRTRGGRSTYQCSYTVPPTLVAPSAGGATSGSHSDPLQMASQVKSEPADGAPPDGRPATPPLLKVRDGVTDRAGPSQSCVMRLTNYSETRPR